MIKVRFYSDTNYTLAKDEILLLYTSSQIQVNDVKLEIMLDNYIYEDCQGIVSQYGGEVFK